MIDIIEVFFDLYEKNKIKINWKKENPGFNITDNENNIADIVTRLNADRDELDFVDEDYVINNIFAIIINRIDYYFDKEKVGSNLTEYINNNVNSIILDSIHNNIFYDNNILNNRLISFDYEVLTKRLTNDITQIGGYTVNVLFKSSKDYQSSNNFELELTVEELEELISKLNDAKTSVDLLNNNKE